MISLHHVHIFASDIDATVRWYEEMLGGVVAFDGEFGGVRNVFMRIGGGARTTTSGSRPTTSPPSSGASRRAGWRFGPGSGSSGPGAT